MATPRRRKTGSRSGPRDGSSPGPRKKPKTCKK